MEYKDYYKTLGVARDAGADDIKRAYRKLARKYHPDVSKEANAEARFKEVNEANAVLGDPEKRAAYDALGSGWHAGEEFRPPPGAGPRGYRVGPEDFGDLGDFSDFFSSIFGQQFHGAPGAGRRPRRGQDQSVRIEIDLEEAYTGGTRQLRLDVPEVSAEGHVVTRGRTLNVKIPAGVTQGRQIRLAGQGAPGLGGGEAGDLYLEVDFKPHRLYTPEGKDIHLRLPIAPWEAALGATVPVPTLGGTVNLKIPAGSQGGQRLRLKGRGLPGNPPGDEMVTLEIVTPPAASDAVRKLYQQLAAEAAFDPRADLGL